MKKNLFLLKMLVALTLLTGPFSLMDAHGAGFSNFSSVASLTTGRYNHTATLLPNGKVLVAGGQSGGTGSVNASAELYDPINNTWSKINNDMSSPRYNHTATLLANGKVLVTGGQVNSTGILASAELYDPVTNTWSAAASMSYAHSLHTSTLLPGGRVLVVGGQSNSGLILSYAELYDPATNTWSMAGNMDSVRVGHAAALLANGKVMVTGGGSSGNTVLDTAELYDPSGNTWSAVAGNMSSARKRHTATLLRNGMILVTGGNDGSTAKDSADFYDPENPGSGWTTVSMNNAREQHTATLLANGKVLVTGGLDENGMVFVDAELSDPDGTNWTVTGSMIAPRYQHSATLLPDGRLLVAGGSNNSSGLTLITAEVYNSAIPSWSAAQSMGSPRQRHSVTLLPNGKLLVVGGYDGNSAMKSAELYDSAGNTWSVVDDMNTDRYDHTATLLPNGKVLVAGGNDGSESLNSAELYDSAGHRTPAGSMVASRSNHTAVLLSNGKVLVAGGVGSDDLTLGTAELYDPAADSWTAISNSMFSPRSDHTATLLPNGKVLVAGGKNDSTVVASAELYDPAGSWSLAGSMGSARERHTATLLSNGKLLVVGGSGINGTVLASAELYDPAPPPSGTIWTIIGNMSNARVSHVATLLPNGKVLVTGGKDGSAVVDSAEFYDPAGSTWRVAGNMGSPRVNHTGTLLPSGKVLVVGGNDGSGTVNSTKFFDLGLGFSDGQRPVVTDVSIIAGSKLRITGSGFLGASEASGGSTNSSSTGFPLARLQRVDNDQTTYLMGDPTTNWSDTLFTSQTLSALPMGHYRITVYSNGIPSMASFALITPTASPSVASIDFGSSVKGDAPVPTRTFTITNTGVADLVVSSGAISPPLSPFTVNGGGTKPLAPGEVATYTLTLPTTTAGEFEGDVTFTTNDPDPAHSTITVSLSGEVTLLAPIITGPAPLTSVNAGEEYKFTPIAPRATHFSIKMDNIPDKWPSWAHFDSTTGTLSGTPLNTDVGVYSNIIITATNGVLPDAQVDSFSITVVISDITKPVVTKFTVPGVYKSLTVPVTITAKDNVAIAAYLITESPTLPINPVWSATSPTVFPCSGPADGPKTLYAWVKDTAGNVSKAMKATVKIDTQLPTVAFTIPQYSKSLTIHIDTLTVTDNVKVAGYLMTESNVPPLANNSGWKASKPASYPAVGLDRSLTLYAWAKDTAGNVAASLPAITVIDTKKPKVTDFEVSPLSGLTADITGFLATDENGVAGYMITQSSVPPSASSSAWKPYPPILPAPYKFSSGGIKTLYAWVKDSAGNVSAVSAVPPTSIAKTMIDIKKPVVTVFQVSPRDSDLTVQVNNFTATDNLAVSSYLITESPTPTPTADNPWSDTPQTDYKFTDADNKTLYAWAKDIAGNISKPKSVKVTIAP